MIVLTLAVCRCAPADPTPAQAYLDRLMEANAAAVADLDDYVGCAGIAAELLVRDPDGPGPTLWLAGDDGLVTEGSHRAGGLMIAKRLSSPDEIAVGDVVLVGSLGGREPPHGDDGGTRALVEACVARGGLVVLFAPEPTGSARPSPELLAMLSTQGRGMAEDGHGCLFLDAHADPPGSDELPTASPAIAQSLWAFTGELVTAMMRSSGRMPPVYLSVHVPDGRERNSARSGLRWDTEMPGSLPAGLAARKYLARLANIMQALRETQAPLFAEAGARAAEVIAGGRTVWYASIGHLPPSQPAQVPAEGLPFSILKGVQPDRVRELVRPGDLVLYVGYYEPFGPWVEEAHGAGAEIVTVLSGTPERSAAQMGADINIRGCWPWGDALIGFYPPTTDITMLPPSGVIQSAAFWMLLAETRAALR